jgi:hypothetical protein
MKKIKNYFIHLVKNWDMAYVAFLLFLIHFIHGIIPCKFTSYKYWGIYLMSKPGAKDGDD